MAVDKKEAEYVPDLLQALELTDGQAAGSGEKTDQHRREIDMAKMNRVIRTADMNHIVGLDEIRPICEKAADAKNLQDWKRNFPHFCNNSTKCMNCKATSNLRDMENSYKPEMANGMMDYLDAMKTNDDWMNGDMRKKFFMMMAKMSDGHMKHEKKNIAWYGGVRMTSKETTRMAEGMWRHQCFWGYITVYEDPEERGGTIQKVGFKFYRDLGNGAYTDFLMNAVDKAKEDQIIDAGDW